MLWLLPTFVAAQGEVVTGKVVNDSTAPWIRMERRGCDGKCPDYRIDVFKDGRVGYEGYEFVKTIGKAKGEITKEQIKILESKINAIKFFSLNGSYGHDGDGCASMRADASSVDIMIWTGSNGKAISRYTGCDDGPPKYKREMNALKEFDELIDKVVNIRQWIGNEEEREKFTHLQHLN
ncbi:MAG: hypothetical protein KF685_10390 [Acidobacteria bacterium]|nr:hypothetical protein [Acidobacteriota bacterium]